MLSTLSLIGFGQTCVLLLAVLVLIKSWTPLKWASIVVLSLVGLRLLKTAFSQPDSVTALPLEFMVLTSSLGLLILPSLFIFQQILQNPDQKLRRSMGFHLLIPMLNLVYSVKAFQTLNHAETSLSVLELSSADILALSLHELLITLDGPVPLTPIFAVVQTIIYALFSYRQWIQSKSQTSPYENWAGHVASFILINCIGIFVLLLASALSASVSLNAVVTLATLCSLTFIYGWLLLSLFRLKNLVYLKHTESTDNTNSPEPVTTKAQQNLSEAPKNIEPNADKYAKSGLSEARMKILSERATDLLADQKLFKQPELTLAYLAEQIGCSTHHLSQSLNTQLNRGYADLVTEYRLLEAKTLLATEPRKPVLDVAMDAGFNSKSGFYSAFKKATGLTPSAFRSNLDADSFTKSVRTP